MKCRERRKISDDRVGEEISEASAEAGNFQRREEFGWNVGGRDDVRWEVWSGGKFAGRRGGGSGSRRGIAREEIREEAIRDSDRVKKMQQEVGRR